MFIRFFAILVFSVTLVPLTFCQFRIVYIKVMNSSGEKKDPYRDLI